MKKIVFCLCISIIVFLASCMPTGDIAYTFNNDAIDAKIASEISALENKAIESIKARNVQGIQEIATTALKDEDINDFMDNIDTSGIKPEDLNFVNFERYYSHVKSSGTFNFTITTDGSDPFYASLGSHNQDLALSLISTDNGVVDQLLTLAYVNENGKWKLYNMYLSTYSLQGMNAMEMYEKAKTLDEKGYKLPACLYMFLAKELLSPAPLLQYKYENNFNNYYNDILGRINGEYIFPFNLENMAYVAIYGFRMEFTLQGLYPVIRYVTSLKRSDTSAVESEARDIHKEITALFPGMKEEFSCFIYEAYFEPPVDSEKKYDCYRTLIEP